MKVCSTQVSSQSNLDNKTSSIILTSERSLKPNLSRLLKTGTEQNPLALAMGSVSGWVYSSAKTPFPTKKQQKYCIYYTILTVNNLALKDEAFLAFRPHLIKRKRLLLSKRLWIDAMGEVYDSLTGFLK